MHIFMGTCKLSQSLHNYAQSRINIFIRQWGFGHAHFHVKNLQEHNSELHFKNSFDFPFLTLGQRPGVLLPAGSQLTNLWRLQDRAANYCQLVGICDQHCQVIKYNKFLYSLQDLKGPISNLQIENIKIVIEWYFQTFTFISSLKFHNVYHIKIRSFIFENVLAWKSTILVETFHHGKNIQKYQS